MSDVISLPVRRTRSLWGWIGLSAALVLLLLIAHPGSALSVTGASTVDADGDGFLDHIKVTTDVAVSDDTLSASAPNWAVTVPSHTVSDVVTDLGTTGAGDNVFYLVLNELTSGDTGTTPVVEYTAPAPTSPPEILFPTAVTDAADNPLTSYGPSAATDGAGPAVTKARVNLGSNQVTVTLSEPAVSISTLQVTYQNGGAGGATGIALANHAANTASITVTLTAPTAFADLGADAIGITATVKDAANNAAGTAKAVLVDDIVPTISTIATQDTDLDGHLDGLLVTFSEPVKDPTSFVLTDWTLGGAYGDAGHHPTSISTGTADDAQIRLVFAELATPDTDAVPAVSYTSSAANRLKDLSANGLADVAGVASVDKAAPAVISAVTQDTALPSDPTFPQTDGRIDQIVLTYSEALATGSFDVSEWSVSGYTVLDGSNLPGAEHLVRFTLSPGLAPDTAATPNVVHVASGSFDDGHGNLVASGTIATTDGAGPVLVSVDASVGDKTALAEFSEPVKGPGADSTLVKASFDDSGAGSNAAKLASVTHTAGSRFVTLTFQNAWLQSDFTLPAAMAVTADAVYDAVNNAAVVAPRALSQGATEVAALQTLDVDGDGLIDGVIVQFSEKIADPTHLPPQEWIFGLADDGHQYGVADFGDPMNAATLYYRPTEVVSGATANDAFIFLLFPERDDVDTDTGVTFPITYDPNGADDLQVPLKGQDGLDVLALASQPTQDGIPPRLVSALTRDADGDGQIDHYVLTFSETVNEATFLATQWTVGGAPITALDISSGVYTNDDGSRSNEILVIAFPENGIADTAMTPDIGYASKGTLTDAHGIVFTGPTSATRYLDGAAPALIQAVSEVGSRNVEILFSEGVYGSGSDGSLQYLQDFGYVDAVPEGTSRSVQTYTHTAGSPIVTAVMTKSFKGTNDFGADRFYIQSTVVDADGVSVNGDQVLLQSASSSDSIAPGSLTDLTLTDVGSTAATLSWTAPGDDGSGGGKVSAYQVKISTVDFAATDFEGQDDALVTFTPSTLALPAGTQTATITGLSASTDYFIRIRAVDEAQNAGPITVTVMVTTETTDTTAPAAISDLEIVPGSVTANSVEVHWTAPGDDGDTGGPVAGYQLRVSGGPIDDVSFGGLADATFTLGALADPGQTQTATVTGLSAGSERYLAVRALDEADNAGPISNVLSFTTGLDTSAPAGTLTVTSSTHSEGVATLDAGPVLSWSGLTDSESTITYYYVLDHAAGTILDGTEDDSTLDTTVTFSNLADGTWYFHVVGVSAGGLGDQADYQIIVGAATPEITPTQVKNTNDGVTVTVTRADDTNLVEWDLPSSLPGTPAGVQIWRSNSPYVLVTEVTQDFQSGSYIDSSSAASADSHYLVTVFYDAGVGHFSTTSPPSTTDYPGFAPASESSGGLPAWFWFVVIGAGVLLLVVLLVVLVRRGGHDDEPEDDLWSAATEGTESVGSVTLSCPECGAHFSASGERPIVTNCPGCGRRGILR